MGDKRPETMAGEIGECGGITGECAAALSSRRDNPVWEGCAITGIQTGLKVEGELSIVTVVIGVKNSGKTAVGGFLVPIQPTTAEIAFGVEKEAFDTLGLRFGAIAAGAEVQARGEFRILGKPKALWVGVQL